MHIQRQVNGIAQRKKRRNGCMPLLVIISVLLGILMIGRDWLTQLFNGQIRQARTDAETISDAYEAGNLDATIAAALSQLETKTDDTNTLSLLVRALIYRSYADFDTESDRQLALNWTTQALEQTIGNADIMGLHALALQANGQSEPATRTALRAIDRDRENIPARIALALAYGGQGLFEVALRESQRAVEIAQNGDPSWLPDSYRALAIAYSDLGRYQEAIVAIEQAIHYHDRLIPLYFERALYALQLSDGSAATVAYFRILALDEQNVKARYRLCQLASRMAERDSAIRYCGEVTELAPLWPVGWFELGRQYYYRGDYAESLRALRRCSTLEVSQGVPIAERTFECWYLQGQSAEILGDCSSLMVAYNEFRAMASIGNLPQTWTYPPEGPSICLSLTQTPVE